MAQDNALPAKRKPGTSKLNAMAYLPYLTFHLLSVSCDSRGIPGDKTQIPRRFKCPWYCGRVGSGHSIEIGTAC
jgi:hypothetical protein